MPNDFDQRISALSPAKQQLLARLARHAQSGARALPTGLGAAPVAVIGLDCRFPGAPDPAAFWALLREGVDAIGPVPAERWDSEALFDPSFAALGKVATRWGGFINGVDGFDAAAFGISPREAAMLDPQHRLLLAGVWHALDNAGIPKERLAGSQTGVFLSVYQRDYAQLALAHPRSIDAYTASGTHHSIAAGRLSYLYDLRGPSLVVDTACSSSLVALHLACRSLLAGECELAIVGAANLMLSAAETMALSRWGMLAADGRCKAFDDRADGFVRGEGAGVLIVKPLAAALRDGDRVRAVVVGTASAQDGRSHGLTAPNGLAQQAVIRQALADAQIEPSAVSYVEAHGTGTALGDPIEMDALRASYDSGGESAPPCSVGSVKTNIGHLEAAAGMAGVIKTLLCLEHGMLVPSLHLRRLNPSIDLAGSRLRVSTERSAWTGVRHAAISSFGMGGTNAHIVLRSADPVPTSVENSQQIGDALLLPLSAHDPMALRQIVADYAELLSAAPASDGAAAAAICMAASQRRSHHPLRLAVSADDATTLRYELGALSASAGSFDERLSTIELRRALCRERPLVMLFPGQGSQWRGMAVALSSCLPFQQVLEECDAYVRDRAGWSLLDELRRPSARFDRIDVAQPLLFAYQVGLAALWQSWGIQPQLVVGHSMGEVAAACVAGALSLKDALTVIVTRSQRMSTLGGQGAMLAVDLGAAELGAWLAQWSERIAAQVAVAADNGPHSSVLSGTRGGIQACAALLVERGVEVRPIAVDVASHSPLMDGVGAALRSALAELSPREGSVGMVSTVEGTVIDGRLLDADYWQRNLRQQVRLWPALAPLLHEHPVIVEMSPHPLLLHGLAQAPAAASALLLPSCRREREAGTLLHSLGQMYELGTDVAWSKLGGKANASIALPRYPFQCQRHWLPTPPERRASHDHPLLGEHTAGPGFDLFTGPVTLAEAPFLADHHVEGHCVVPGMGAVDMALSALNQLGAMASLSDIRFHRPIILSVDNPAQLQLRISDDNFSIWGRDADGWVHHNGGAITPALARSTVDSIDVVELLRRGRPGRDAEAFYARLNQSGNYWGPAFCGVQRIHHVADGEVLAELSLPSVIADQAARFAFHPAWLDACGQAMFELIEQDHPGPVVLAAIDKVQLYGRADAARYSHIRRSAQQQQGSFSADVRIVDRDGGIIAEILGLRIQFLYEFSEHWQYQRCWTSAPASAAALPEGDWLLVGGGALAQALAYELSVQTSGHVLQWQSGPFPEQRHFNIVALASPSDDQADIASRQRRVVADCADLVATLRWAAPGSRFWCVSRGAMACSPRADLDPWQAPRVGLAQVLRSEHPETHMRVVDLSLAGDTDALAALIVKELCSPVDEPLVAWRDGERWLPRLMRAPRPDPAARWRLRPDACYLISGGLGGVSFELGKRLIERGARHLLLLSRGALPPRERWHSLVGEQAERVARVVALEQAGAAISVRAVDVADEAALWQLADRWREQRRPRIAGIFHAAGIQHRRALLQLDPLILCEELAAKVAGSAALWRIWGAQIDIFIGFSSASTLLPSPLLGAYTAANAFLDAFAEQQRRAGHPVTAVSWGVWHAAGMAERYEREHGRTVVGMARMAPERALDAMEQSHLAGQGHLGVMALDLRGWQRRLQAAPDPYLAQLFGRDAGSHAGADAAPQAESPSSALSSSVTPLSQQLTTAVPADRSALVEAYLVQALAVILRAAPDRIDTRRPLTALGVDSLMALELRHRIQRETGAALSVVDILRCPATQTLANTLTQRLAELALEPSDSCADDVDEFMI